VNDKNKNPDIEFPDKLIEDIKNLHKQTAQVPLEVDRIIIDRAHQHFAQKEFTKTKKRRFRLVHLWKVAAAAAVIILAFSLDLTLQPVLKEEPESVPMMYQMADLEGGRSFDIDNNGRVDILDAFTLARRIESEDYAEFQSDINNDGMVNRDDVDEIAMAAVRLDKGVL
jgi:hypothetical protein